MENNQNSLQQTSQNNNNKDLKNYLEKFKNELQRALPKAGLTVDRLISVCLTAQIKTPQLKDCEINSVFACILQSAQLGLEVNTALNHAVLLPFRDKRSNKTLCNLIIQYQGFIELWNRSGKVLNVHSAQVYENDKFEFKYGKDAYLTHEPKMNNRGKGLDIYYAYANLANGGFEFVVLGTDDINAAKSHSKSTGEYSIWEKDRESMAIKTCYRRLNKKMPKSAEIAKAERLETLREYGQQKIELTNINETGELDLSEPEFETSIEIIEEKEEDNKEIEKRQIEMAIKEISKAKTAKELEVLKNKWLSLIELEQVGKIYLEVYNNLNKKDGKLL